MAEPSGRHRIRKFLASRKHKRQPSDPEDILRASNTSSVVSLPESAIVAMEGNLKKRLAKMPVMHDRYCVATWELDADERKRVMLRSYKSRKAYDSRPEKPSSVQQLECINDWDGKTGFHRYQNAFTIETRDKKSYQCVAPCPADKVKWMGLMDVHSRRDRRLNSVGNLGSRRRTQSVEASASSEPRAYTGPSMARSVVNASQLMDTEEQSNFLNSNRLFRTTSDASADSLEELTHDENEPVDWGLYGNENTTYKYEVQEDSIPVLLDKELLDLRERENKTLATDRFLFDEAGASRFGAVVVKGAGRDEENDDADFVDEVLVAREAKKKNERNMKRRAQKLESNRDRYAEMAAARLAGMRKDARHPKKRHGLSDISLFVDSENSDVELYDEEQSIIGEEVEGIADLEDTNQPRSSLRSRCSFKSQKQSFVSNSDKGNSVTKGYASGEDELEMEDEDQEAVPPAAIISAQITTAECAEAKAGSADAERIEFDMAEAEEVEELRQLKRKYRAERRAKKRLLREKEEEERTTLEAAELARAHREEQRAREEAKAREEQEKREKKKECREVKAKLKREKAKQRQAEADVRKLAEFNQAEEERRERKRTEKKGEKKSKKKEKYTSPAERIQRKEVRDAERATATDEAKISNALVVVEKSAETVQQPVAAPAPAFTSTSSVQTEAASTQQAACAYAPPTFPAPSPVPVPVVAPAVISSSAAEVAAVAAQAMPAPIYQMCPPPFVPSYPTCPQSMPAYGLAATFGAYPPFYLAPYNYGGPTGLQPALMRPNMGFVAGLSTMNSFGTAAGPAPAPSISNSAEPMVGPQLPNSKENAETSLTGASPLFSPPPSMGKSIGVKLTNLPELPDVIEF
ncbi:unnamed protein product [Peronospora farinosa]|uniref:Uncharacterized protein n=1 Tax=Peronospora farinosa TaxID=134698 RepID=A0AAV0SSL2_9STRA|nr:unnamed protein product [Peronospora farinosa]CAI5707433.1 unnamed protein product [Peronospora farinosa]